MAIAFNTDTINQPDAGSVGLAMAEQLRDDIVAHAAWELVEEFTPSSGVARYYVFKCLSSVSGLSADFFVVMARTLSNGSIAMSLCEGYNSGTHTMTKYTPEWSSVSSTISADGTYNASFVLGTSGFTGVNGTPTSVSWTPSGTSTKFWSIVADDSVSVAFNGAANGFFHAGAYTYLGDLTNALPLNLIGSSRTNGAIARNPAIAGLSISAGISTMFNTYAGGGAGILSIGTGNLVPLGFQGFWAADDPQLSNERAVAEVGMTTTASATYIPVAGYVLGKQKRMRFSAQAAPAGIAFGDAFVLNGTLWVPYLPGDGRIWDTGVAA